MKQKVDEMRKRAELALSEGHIRDAVALLEQIIALQSEQLGAHHPDTLATMHRLAVIYRVIAKYAQSEALFARVVALRKSVLGENHPDTLISMREQAMTFRMNRRLEDCIQLLEEVLDRQRHAPEMDEDDRAQTIYELMSAYRRAGRTEDAERLFRIITRRSSRKRELKLLDEKPVEPVQPGDDTPVPPMKFGFTGIDFGHGEVSAEPAAPKACPAPMWSVRPPEPPKSVSAPPAPEKRVDGTPAGGAGSGLAAGIAAGSAVGAVAAAPGVTALSAVLGLFKRKPKPEPPKPQTPAISQVTFSVVAPERISKGKYGLIDLYVHEEAFRYVVDQALAGRDQPMQESRSSPTMVRAGAKIRVVLSADGLTVRDSDQVYPWHKGYLRFSFAVLVPRSFEGEQLLLTAHVYVDEVPACKLNLTVDCLTEGVQSMMLERMDIRTGFMSYASQDRNRVLSIVQGMEAIRPDFKAFVDLDQLRSGENWKEKLAEAIQKNDVLFLCWSQNARNSEWVDWEWNYALQEKGIDKIEPVTVVNDGCPPPEKLNQKHFGSRWLYLRDHTKENY